jgi:D-lactate dehydrogenase (cytochrome)
VLIELGSSSATAPLRSLFENAAALALESSTILDAVIAESDAQGKQFWSLREHISDSLRKQGRGIHFDVSLPLSGLAAFLDETNTKIKAAAPAITLMPFGHIGDGNIHYNMYLPSATDDAAFTTTKKRIQDIVFGEIEKRQGSISAEHGIGIERKDVLSTCKSPAEIDLMRTIKRAIDPDGIMNPGKIFD